MKYEAAISINSRRFTLPNHSEYNTVISLGRNYLELAICDLEFSAVHGMQYYYTGSKVLGKKQAVSIFDSQLVQAASNQIVAVDSPKSTLVPSVLFSNSAAYDLLSSQHQILETEDVRVDEIGSFQNLYSIKQGTEKLIKKYMPNASIIHSSTALMKSYAGFKKDKHQIFVSCRDDYIFLSYYKKNELILHHYHSISCADDALYHILNLIQTKKITTSEAEINLHGESHLTKKTFALLESQNLQVQYIDREGLGEFDFNTQILDLPSYQFFNLFSLVKCGSSVANSAAGA